MTLRKLTRDAALRRGRTARLPPALQPPPHLLTTLPAPFPHRLGADGAAPIGRRATAAGRAATRNRNRRAATARSGADSRAAPCGASVPAAGGAGVVLERASPNAAPSPPTPLVVDHAVPSFAVAFEHRLAHRAQGKACVPLQPGADAARPAIDVRFTGARASRYRADAKPGSQPAARSAAATAAARPMPDGISMAAWRWSRPTKGEPEVDLRCERSRVRIRATSAGQASSSQPSLPDVSGSWPPWRIAGTSRRSTARRPAQSASRHTGARRTATQRMRPSERVSSMTCVIRLIGFRGGLDPVGSSWRSGASFRSAAAAAMRSPPGTTAVVSRKTSASRRRSKRRGNARERGPRDAREPPSVPVRSRCGRVGASAPPARSRPATDTRGGRGWRPGGGESVSSCLRSRSAVVVRRCSG